MVFVFYPTYSKIHYTVAKLILEEVMKEEMARDCLTLTDLKCKIAVELSKSTELQLASDYKLTVMFSTMRTSMKDRQSSPYWLSLTAGR